MFCLLVSTLLVCGCTLETPKKEDGLAQRVNTQFLKTVSPMPTQKSHRGQLSVEQSANFKRLEDLLAAGKWKDADVETRQLMLQVGGIELPQNWLDRESIDNFPCDALSTVA
jgi:ABC-type cobalamin/Fe3+-siderophores transport system ATPase subunit